MSGPINLRDLPDDLQDRYGVGRRPWGTIAAIVVVLAIFLVGVGFATVMLAKPSVQSKLLVWSIVSPEHVDATFEVRSTTSESISCVLRAQDQDRADVGYATIPVTTTDGYAQIRYQLRTLARAYVVELLGCDLDTTRIQGPQFPPGVAPPPQPWTG